MKNWMIVLSMLIASSAAAQIGGNRPVDADVLAQAERYAAAHCEMANADGAFVLESSQYEPRRYDQNIFDDVYTMTYGYRSAHTGQIQSGTLVLQGDRSYNEETIYWSVVADAFGVCH